MKTQIVVVGGGAGGLELVRRLGAKLGRRDYDVILVEKNRTHIWKPLLHEVAGGSLDANLDEVGYGGHGYRWRYRFFYGAMESIDRSARQVVIAPVLDEDGSEIVGRHRIRYDYLVLAVGSVSNDFGIPGIRQHCLFLEDRAQADRFRLKLLDHCLRVSRKVATDPTSDARVQVVIVGGGATGVELAAELYNAAAALKHYGLEVFDEKRLTVSLIEAGPRILPALPEALAQAAHEELEALGVQVLVNTTIKEAIPGGVVTGAGVELRADLSVWAAGVKGPDCLKQTDGLELTQSLQLVVRPSLQSSRDDRVFVIGDCAYFVPEGSQRPVPPRAQAAHQMAKTAFRNIIRLLSQGQLEAFVYKDHGSLVSLSRFSTVGSLMGNLIGGRMAIEGRLARMVYLSLYRAHLIGIHGWLKGVGLIVVGHVNQIVRPRIKLH